MPGIPLSLSGIRSGTPYNFVLDAGVPYRDVHQPSLDAGGTTAFAESVDPTNTWTDPNGDVVFARRLGATRGGVSINPGITERMVEVDSARIPIKGFMRIDNITPKLTMNLVELGDPEVSKMIFGGVDVQTLTGWKKYTLRLVVNDADYMGNVAIFMSVSGETQPIAVVMPNAKVVERAEIATADKSEVAVSVTIQGHALASDPMSPPFAWYHPEEFVTS